MHPTATGIHLMETVIIVIHLMVVLALVAVVLLQRSEGGALGIGGGGGGGFMSSRGAANALTRTTAILAAAFFATSIILGIMAQYTDNPADVLDRVIIDQGTEGTGQGVLDLLEPAEEETGEPQVPTSQ